MEARQVGKPLNNAPKSSQQKVYLNNPPIRIRAKNMMMHGRQTLQLPGPLPCLFSKQNKLRQLQLPVPLPPPDSDSRQISKEEVKKKTETISLFVKYEQSQNIIIIKLASEFMTHVPSSYEKYHFDCVVTVFPSSSPSYK